MERRVEEIIESVTERLVSCGLDLVQGFDVARYNDLMADHETLAPLPQFGRHGALALLVGNTKALWPHFIKVFQDDADLAECPDPLDVWIERVVKACLKDVPVRNELRFSHEPGDDLVSMLHLAQASGLAHVGPAHLAIHPEHGSWFGLRAVIIVDAEPPRLPPGPVVTPCKGCHAPCVEALDAALATAPATEIAASWQAWVGVRDACPAGRASRYSEAQIRYHYSKDRTALCCDPSIF